MEEGAEWVLTERVGMHKFIYSLYKFFFKTTIQAEDLLKLHTLDLKTITFYQAGNANISEVRSAMNRSAMNKHGM